MPQAAPTNYQLAGILVRNRLKGLSPILELRTAMTGSTLAIATVISHAAWAGVLLALRADQLLASERRFGGFSKATAVFCIILLPVAGFLTDLWGAQTVLLIGGTFSALAFLAFDRRNSPIASLGAAGLLSGAVAALIVASIVLMPVVFFPAHAARSVNLGCVAVLAGILLSKPLVVVMKNWLGVRPSLLVLALASLAPPGVLALTPSAQLEASSTHIKGPAPVGDLNLWLMALILLMSVPLTTTMLVWARRYIHEICHRPGLAALQIALFWLSFIGILVAAALNLPARAEPVSIVVLALLTAVICGNILSAYGGASTGLGVWIAVACCGPIAPTLLGLVLRTFPDHRGIALGITGTAGMFGYVTILGWIDPWESQRPSRLALRGAMILAVVLLVPALAIAMLVS